MKLILALNFLVVISISSFSQNYQTFNSSNVHYFKEVVSGNVLASEIVSFELESLDTVLFPFLSIRQNDSGVFYDSPSWMGAEIVIKPDGTNLFFNEEGDTITIQTQANYGETFIMYEFPSGNVIEATVDTIVETILYGITDSVKVISLSSLEPEFELGDNQLRIGKNLGLIDVYPFYSFPEVYIPLSNVSHEGISKYSLVGQLSPSMGITKATHYDLNTLNIGDVINYHEFDNDLYEYTHRKKVTDKTISGDIATYTFELYSKYHYLGTSVTDPPTTTYTTEMITESYNISNDYINEYMIPEKNYALGISDKVIGIMHSNSCGFTEQSRTLGTYYLGDGEYYYAGYLQSSFRYYSGGLNQNYHSYNYNDGHDHEKHRKVFNSSRIGDNICGDGSFLKITKDEITSGFTFFPNPANEYIIIQSIERFSYEILDLQGKIVLSGNVYERDFKIAIETLKKGLYFIKVDQEGNVSTQRFIKL